MFPGGVGGRALRQSPHLGNLDGLMNLLTVGTVSGKYVSATSTENYPNYMLINKTTSKTGNPASCSMLFELGVLGAVTQARGQPSYMSLLLAVETIST